MSDKIKCRCIVCNFPMLLDADAMKVIEPVCSTECLMELSATTPVTDYDDAECYPTTSLVSALTE